MAGLKSTLAKAIFSPRFPAWLLGLFVLWFAVWAIRPPHPDDFILEHLLTVAGVAALGWGHRSFRLSNVSYTLIFAFLCLHVVGAHYTYAEVPYEKWAGAVASWFGVEGFDPKTRLGFTRNHYDRLVHFAFGLLCAYPVREVFLRVARVRGFWGYYLPLDVTMSFSMLYELLEWGVAMVMAPELGQSYLGTQGDPWDAHKDMALAASGAVISMSVTALVNWRFRKDFAAELVESLKVHDPRPLGEVKIAEMLEEKRREGG